MPQASKRKRQPDVHARLRRRVSSLATLPGPTPAKLATFRGSSSAGRQASEVPISFLSGRLSKAALRSWRAAWQPVLSDSRWQVDPKTKQSDSTKGVKDYAHQVEQFFRMTPNVLAFGGNGASWKHLAPTEARELLGSLRTKNKRFYSGMRKLANNPAFTYRHAGQNQPVFFQAPDDGLFAYATVQKRFHPRSMKNCSNEAEGFYGHHWHCDGGPSSIFLNVTLEGKRILEIERSGRRPLRRVMRAGDWYLSSPSAFWHNVRPHDPTRDGHSTSIILRSALLRWRLSGGREKDGSGRRSCGFLYSTKSAFEKVLPKIARVMATTGFQME